MLGRNGGFAGKGLGSARAADLNGEDKPNHVRRSYSKLSRVVELETVAATGR
jgi:hypothetical protein